jgi:tetratricopeptide (TPR) repeat protein
MLLFQDAENAELPDLGDRYEILEEIGEGGFGVVQRARQAGMNRDVAIKLYKFTDSTEETQRRFQVELKALGQLRHPNIVTIHEVGLLSGRPAVVMELLAPDETLVRYCERLSLGRRERVNLLIDVCYAVHHLHQREPRILHRDIKPANVLIAEQDGKPVPKLLDFGIVKLIGDTGPDPELPDHLTHAGTPAYMSPEQRTGSGAIGPPSDVFSLGVLAHELLTGELPRRCPPPGAATLASGAPTARRLDDDLSAIVSKALDEQPSQRYESARELAEDFHQYLRRRPVAARRGTRIYVLAKFIRRHILAVTTLAAAALVLVAATAVSIRLRIQSDRAAEASRRTLAFLTDDLLAQADPDIQPNRNMSIRQALDVAAARIEQQSRFTNAPLVEARVRSILGDTYRKLADFPASRTQLGRAVNLFEGAEGPHHADTLRVKQSLCELLVDEGRIGEAETCLIQSVADIDRYLGPDAPDALRSTRVLADVQFHSRRNDEAVIETLKRLLVQQARELGADDEQTIETMSSLASAYRLSDAPHAAEPLARQVAARYRATYGIRSPRTLRAVREEAALFAALGRTEDARGLLREAVAASGEVLGAENPFTLKLTTDLAETLTRPGEEEEAEALYRNAVRALTRALGAWEDNTLAAVEGLALIQARQGRWEAVESDFAPAEVMDQPSSFERAADVYARFGQLEEAHSNLNEVIALDQGSPLALFRAGVLSAAVGDSVGYSATVKSFLATFSQRKEIAVLADLCRLAMLKLPGNVAVEQTDVSEPIAQLRKVDPAQRAPSVVLALALAEYRSGRFGAALDILDRSTFEDPILRTESVLVEAMCRRSLNNVERGRETMNRAIRQAAELPGTGMRELGPRWQEVLVADILLAEAQDSERSPEANADRTPHPFPSDPLEIKLGELARADFLSRRGRKLMRTGNFAEAEAMFRESLAIRKRVANGRWTTGYVECWLAFALAKQNRWAESRKLLDEGWAALHSQRLLLSFPKTSTVQYAACLSLRSGSTYQRNEWQRRNEETPLEIAYSGAARTRKLYRSWNQTETAEKWIPKVVAALESLAAHYDRWRDAAGAAASRREMKLLPSEQRAEKHAHLGGWMDASREYAIALSTNPDDLEVWYNATFVALRLGDSKAHAERCSVMLTRYGKTADLQTAERVAKACLIARWTPTPAQQAAIRNLVRMVEAKIAASPDWLQPWLNLLAGISSYRERRYVEAVRYLENSRYGDTFCQVEAWYFIALSLRHLGEREKAKLSLDEAEARFVRLPNPEKEAVSGWRDWVMCKLVADEARRDFDLGK